MMKYLKLSFFIVSYILDGSYTNGFLTNCEVNKTLLVQESSSARFDAVSTMSDYLYLDLYKKGPKGDNLKNELVVRYNAPRKASKSVVVLYPVPRSQKRTEIKVELTNLSIILHDVEKTDDGSYVLRVDYKSYFCFALFVFGITQQPFGPVREHGIVFFQGYPEPSEIRQVLGKVTVEWLVDGISYLQAGQQIVLQENKIWIASVSRALNGKRISYRAIQDNGSTVDASFMMEVKFGPEAPLLFTPNKAHYFLSSGDKMKDVACSVDCNPACTVSWDRLGKGHFLSLGKVSAATTGEYVCMASTADGDIFVNRSLIVYVTDNVTSTILIAAMAGFQTITAISIGLFICWKKGLHCPSRSKTQEVSVSIPLSGQENTLSEIAMQQYQQLDSRSRIAESLRNYEQIQIGDTSPEQYENTEIA